MTDDDGQQVLAADQQSTTPLTTHRVKFYQLNVDTNWEDKGTGSCTYHQGIDGAPDQLIVHSEEDDSVLMSSDVLKRRLYQRQQDTLIVWTEDDNRDLALSFQDPAGCEQIWQFINSKQGLGSILGGDLESGSSAPVARVLPEISLPEPELSNLKEISTLLSKAKSLVQKDKLAAYVVSENYIDKIVPLFEDCEDLENIADLELLHDIMVGIITLNDHQIIDIALQDDYVTNTMGILEYNPKTPGMKAKHREFIKTHGDVKHVVEITDDNILRKINQTFRLEYLQGIFLHTEAAEEGLMGVVNTMIYQNHLELINLIQNNHFILSDLYNAFKSSETPQSKKDSILQFVHQLCSLTKALQNSARVSMFRSLAPYGLFDMLSAGLVHKTASIRTNSVNLLASFTDLDTTSVRTHIILQARDSESSTKTLMDIIVEQTTKDDEYDSKVQYFEIIRLLLDPNANGVGAPLNTSDPTSKQIPDTDEFLTTFYQKYAKTIMKPIEDIEIKPMLLTGPIEPLELSSDQAQLRLYIIDFYIFVIRNHGFRCKNKLVGPLSFKKVAQLYRSKYAHIKLVALRLFKTCITIQNELYVKDLISQNVFEPTIRLLLDTDGRNCLLNSACLDLIEYIRRENIKPLVSHLVNQFGTVLDTITYISTYKQLRLKYDQNIEVVDSNDSNENSISESTDNKKNNTDGWSLSTMDNEEEDYFNGSDEEDMITQIPTQPTIPLVSYGQDEDEDEDDEDEDTHLVENKKAVSNESSTTATIEEDENIIISAKRKIEDLNTENEGPSPPPIFKARRKLEDEEEEDVLASRIASHSNGSDTDMTPTPDEPSFKSRKKTADEDEEDNLLAKRTARPTIPVPKKMVIKTSGTKNKKMETL